MAINEQLEARLGTVEMPARIFAFLDFLEEACHQRILLVDTRLDGLELFDNEGTPRLVARHEHAVVAHGMRVDVFKTARDLHDAIDMGATLMGKCGITHIRGVHIARQIHDLVDIAAQLAQVRKLSSRNKIAIHLELQISGNRREVRISATFAVTVHHALHHRAARLHGIKRIRDRKPAVVVHMNSKRCGNALLNIRKNFFDFPRHRSAVRIAKHDTIGFALFCSAERFDGVFRVCLVAIEEMFGIVNDFFGMFLEECYRRFNHVEIFCERRANHVRHVQVPTLTKNRLDRSARLHERLQQRVVFRQNFRTASAAKRSNLCMLELNILDKLKKFLIGRIAGVRPTTFNIVKSKVVQNSSNLDFIS